VRLILEEALQLYHAHTGYATNSYLKAGYQATFIEKGLRAVRMHFREEDLEGGTSARRKPSAAAKVDDAYDLRSPEHDDARMESSGKRKRVETQGKSERPIKKRRKHGIARDDASAEAQPLLAAFVAKRPATHMVDLTLLDLLHVEEDPGIDPDPMPVDDSPRKEKKGQNKKFDFDLSSALHLSNDPSMKRTPGLLDASPRPFGIKLASLVEGDASESGAEDFPPELI